MAQRRNPAFVSISAIAKLLVGDRMCPWGIWFAAHHTDFPRVPNSFDTAGWRIEHTAMLHEAIQELKVEYPIVRREYQNDFRYRRGSIIVSGRPDLIACRPGEALIRDEKTGHTRCEAHVAQVRGYMVVVPLVFSHLAGRRLRGCLRYKSGTLELDPLQPDDPFIMRFWEVVDQIAAVDPPERVPSARECTYHCPITMADCPDRIDTGDSAPQS